MTVSELIRTDADTIVSAGIDALVELLGEEATVHAREVDGFDPTTTRSVPLGDATVSVGLAIPEEAGLLITQKLHPDPEDTPDDLTVDDVVSTTIEAFFDAAAMASGVDFEDTDDARFDRVVTVEFGQVQVSVGLSSVTVTQSGTPTTPTPGSVNRLADVLLDVKVELGRSRIPIKDLLALDEGGVIRLGRPVGEPVDLVVNGTITAHGEIVVVDGRLGLKITALA